MKKIGLIFLMVLTGMANFTFANGSQDQVKTLRLKASIADSENSVFYTGISAFKKEVEAKAAGKVEVNIYPNGLLGNLRETVEGLQMGTIDITVANSSVVSNFCPDVGIFDLPFLFDSNDHAYRAMDGDVGKTLNSELEKQKLIVLGWWPIGFRNVTLGEPISSIDQLKGKRIRIMDSQVFQETFRSLGVDPVPLNFSELYTALQQKTVDGQENPYATILDAKLYEVNKFIIETGHSFTPAAMMISEKTWNKFSADQQNMLKEAGKIATEACRKAYEERTVFAKKEMTEKYGVKIITLDKAKMRAMTQGVYKNYPQLAPMVSEVEALR